MEDGGGREGPMDRHQRVPVDHVRVHSGDKNIFHFDSESIPFRIIDLCPGGSEEITAGLSR